MTVDDLAKLAAEKNWSVKVMRQKAEQHGVSPTDLRQAAAKITQSKQQKKPEDSAVARDAEQRRLAENIKNNPSVGDIFQELVREANRLGLGHDGDSSYASQGGSRYLHVGKKNRDGLWNDDMVIRVANHGGRTPAGPAGNTLTTTQDPAELKSNIEAAKNRMRKIAK